MAKPTDRTYSPKSAAAVAMLGELIKTQRLLTGVTSVELCAKAGISRGLLNRIEKGDMGVSIGVAFHLADILSIPLFDGDDGLLIERLADLRRLRALLPQRVSEPTRKKDRQT